MAVTLTFNMTLTNDAEVTEVRGALKVYFGTPSATDAELIEALRQEYMVRLKDIVQSTNKKAAVTTAEAGDYTITVT